ncbi:MAG: hypothetical protein ACRD0I_02595 [Acidimicrobiales bacterium]
MIKGLGGRGWIKVMALGVVCSGLTLTGLGSPARAVAQPLDGPSGPGSVMACQSPAPPTRLPVNPQAGQYPTTPTSDPICADPRIGLNTIGHLVGGLTGGIVGFGADAILGAISAWVATGAVWLLGQVNAALSATTRIDIGAGWFKKHFQVMVGLAGVLIIPLLLLSMIQGIIRQDLAGMVRSLIVNMPLALVLMGLAMTLVQLALTATDDLSGIVASGMGADAKNFLGALAKALADVGTVVGGPVGAPVVPIFVSFFAALIVAMAAFVIWLELVVRSSSIYVAVLFLPLALAGLVWPATAHWAKKLVEVMAALIMSKFFVVAVMSLAVGAVSGQGGDRGFSAVVSGIALLLLAAFTPFALLRVIPMAESGLIAHLEEHPARARRLPGATARLAMGSLPGDNGTGSSSPAAEELVSAVGIPESTMTSLPKATEQDKADQMKGFAPRGQSWSQWQSGLPRVAPDVRPSDEDDLLGEPNGR